MASGNPLVRWLNNKLSVPQNNSFSDMELELAYQTFKQLCQSPKGMSPGVREMRVEIPSEQQSLFSELLNLPRVRLILFRMSVIRRCGLYLRKRFRPSL